MKSASAFIPALMLAATGPSTSALALDIDLSNPPKATFKFRIAADGKSYAKHRINPIFADETLKHEVVVTADLAYAGPQPMDEIAGQSLEAANKEMESLTVNGQQALAPNAALIAIAEKCQALDDDEKVQACVLNALHSPNGMAALKPPSAKEVHALNEQTQQAKTSLFRYQTFKAVSCTAQANIDYSGHFKEYIGMTDRMQEYDQSIKTTGFVGPVQTDHSCNVDVVIGGDGTISARFAYGDMRFPVTHTGPIKRSEPVGLRNMDAVKLPITIKAQKMPSETEASGSLSFKPEQRKSVANDRDYTTSSTSQIAWEFKLGE